MGIMRGDGGVGRGLKGRGGRRGNKGGGWGGLRGIRGGGGVVRADGGSLGGS